MKKIFLSLFCLLGFATFALADHAQKLTVTVPAQTEACYAIGTFNSWKLENIIPMDLETATGENRVFSCTIMVPDEMPSSKDDKKFKFLAGGQSYSYEQNEDDFYYDDADGYNRTVSGFKKYASHGNVVRFVCSATTEKVYLAGKFAGNDWQQGSMIRMVEVESERTTTTKTFQARVGTNESNMEFKYMPWGREWDNQTTNSNNKFNEMPKDANGAVVNEYITVNITAPEGTKEVYLMGHWGDKGTDANRAHKCVKTGDNTFVGIIPSIEECNFRCYNKKNKDNYEVDNNDSQVTRSTGDATNKEMNITVDKWRYADEFTQYYVTGTSNLGHDEGKGDSWNEKQLKMSASGTLTLTNRPAGDYEMKVTDGNWGSGHEFGWEQLNKEASSQYITKKDNNICFYLTEAGDVTVSIVEGSVTVTGSTIGEKPKQYYLTGIGGWDAKQHALDVVTRTYKKKDLDGGNKECKITDGKWASDGGHEWGYAQFDQEHSNITLTGNESNNNICFSLNKKSDVVFQMVDDKVVINQQYYVTGIEGWNERQIPMELYSRTYTANLPAGGYECKVTSGNWDNILTYKELDQSSSANVYTTSNNNIAFVLAEAGEVTIRVTNDNKVLVTGSFVESATYTLEGNGGDDATGTWCHGKDWNTSASQMYDNTITFNDVPKGTWKCKVTNAGKTFEWGYTEVDLDQSSCLVKCESEQDNGIRIELPYQANITITVENPDAEKKIIVLVSPAQLDEDADNSTLINDIHDKTVEAQLLRSFVADGYWYTLCLPFDLTAEQIAASIGGCQLMKLNSSYMKTAETLYLDFKEETTIEAGVPYLFMPNNDVENPIFKAVQTNKYASLTVNTDKASMTGFYQPTVVAESNYFLGENNYLMKNSDASESKAFRAYFTLSESVPAHVMARVVFGQGAPTTMDEVKASKSNRLIMYNGHIFIEKEGVRYTLIGQRL